MDKSFHPCFLLRDISAMPTRCEMCWFQIYRASSNRPRTPPTPPSSDLALGRPPTPILDAFQGCTSRARTTYGVGRARPSCTRCLWACRRSWPPSYRTWLRTSGKPCPSSPKGGRRESCLACSERVAGRGRGGGGVAGRPGVADRIVFLLFSVVYRRIAS